MASRLLLCLICIALLDKTVYVAAQTESQPDRTILAQKQKKFAHYGQDFLDFARSDEYQLSSDLAQVASENGDHLNSAATLLEIYDTLSCPSDRIAVRALIKTQFVYFSKEVALYVKLVNLDIAHLQKPEVAAEAGRMRDDLREVQDLFDSIKLP
jgi:hypothetical protein